MSTGPFSAVSGAWLVWASAGWLLLGCQDTVLAPIRGGDAGAGAGDVGEVGCEERSDASCSCAEGTARGSACVQPRCVEGMYEGSWVGVATPSVGGIPGLFTGLADSDHHVMILFSLRLQEAEGSRRSGDGCVHSNDLVAGISLPENSIAELRAEVDCSTGEFTGEGRGSYWSPSATGIGPYYYKCSMSGVFDPDSQSFVNGSFEMREPPPLVGDAPGATGTWSAQLRPNQPVPRSETCLEEPFPEELFSP